MQLAGLRPRRVPDRLAGGCDHGQGELRRQPQLHARDGADLQHGLGVPGRDRALRLHHADGRHPDQHPDPRADRDRLRASHDGHRDQPANPARLGRTGSLGLPGRRSKRLLSLPPRHARETGRLPGRGERPVCFQLRRASTSVEPFGRAADRQPHRLHRRRTPCPARRHDLPGHRTSGACRRHLSGHHRLLHRDLQPGLQPGPDDGARRLGIGARDADEGIPVPGLRQLAVDHPLGGPDAAGRPFDQPRRGGRAAGLLGRPGQLRQRGPRRMPRQRQDRQLRHRDAGARRAAHRLDLHRRTATGQPVPRVPDRQRLRHQLEDRRVLHA